MEKNADSYLDDVLKQKDKYWEGISDRTRTLCLGSLVLVWGILSQKPADSGLNYSAHTKSDLLMVAGCFVVVLGFDFVEYLAGFWERRKQASDKLLFSSFRYDLVEEAMRSLKVIVGLVALIALCIVLTNVVSGAVHAQDDAAEKFYGTWCGGDRQKGAYSCLRVSNPQGQIIVQFNYQGQEDWIICGHVYFSTDDVLDAMCGRAQTENTWQNARQIKMRITIQNDGQDPYEDTRLLHKIPQ